MKKILFILILISILTNIPPLKWVWGQEDLLYSNSNGSFTFDEVNNQGRNYKLCLENFQSFKATHPNDTLLYRITSMNIFSFWRWANYLFDKKYKLPYKSWEEIEAVRGSIKYKTNWQAF